MDRLTKAWGQLLADIIAGGYPFKSRTTGRQIKITSDSILFEHSSGAGYEPAERSRMTGVGLAYMRSAYHNTGRLGSSPAEYRSKFFPKRG